MISLKGQGQIPFSRNDACYLVDAHSGQNGKRDATKRVELYLFERSTVFAYQGVVIWTLVGTQSRFTDFSVLQYSTILDKEWETRFNPDLAYDD